MTKELLRARNLLSVSEKAELDILVQAQEVDVEGPSLIGVLGKKGERWSQDVIEIGMELMEKGLSARQAEAVTRVFVHFLYPELKEGVDYRIPSHQRFEEWRSFLGPVSHYIAVSHQVGGQRPLASRRNHQGRHQYLPDVGSCSHQERRQHVHDRRVSSEVRTLGERRSCHRGGIDR